MLMQSRATSNSPILTIQRPTSTYAFLQRGSTKLPVATARVLRAPVIAAWVLAEGRNGVFPLCDGVEAIGPGECGGGAGGVEEEGCEGDVHFWDLFVGYFFWMDWE